MIKMAIAGLGGWRGYFLGGMDGLMIVLLVFILFDYIIGVMCAIIDEKLSHVIGFKGVCKKKLILMLVRLTHIIDLHAIGSRSALRGTIICFYLSNERLSLLENATHLGLPVSDKLEDCLVQMDGWQDEKKITTNQNCSADGKKRSHVCAWNRFFIEHIVFNILQRCCASALILRHTEFQDAR